MKLNYAARRLTAVAALLCGASLSLAQTNADDILRQAQERAAKIEEYRQLLNNPDQNVRVAGLDVMLKSDDPAMREIAFNIALASADDAMRAIALKNKFLYLKNLNFQLSLGDSPTEIESKAIGEYFGSTFAIELENYDANTGAFTFQGSHGKGQVSGTGMDLQDTYRRCVGNFTLGDGPELVGKLNCTYHANKGSYNATLRLQ
jgi:hypothetical protein